MTRLMPGSCSWRLRRKLRERVTSSSCSPDSTQLAQHMSSSVAEDLRRHVRGPLGMGCWPWCPCRTRGRNARGGCRPLEEPELLVDAQERIAVGRVRDASERVALASSMLVEFSSSVDERAALRGTCWFENGWYVPSHRMRAGRAQWPGSQSKIV